MKRCDYCARLFVNGSRLNGKDDRIRTIYPHNTHNTATVWFYRAIPLGIQTTDHAKNFKMILVRDGGRRVMPVLSRINSIFALSNQSYILFKVKNKPVWSLLNSIWYPQKEAVLARAAEAIPEPPVENPPLITPWEGQFMFQANRDRWGQTLPTNSGRVSIHSVLMRFPRHYPHTLEPDHRYKFNTDYLPKEELVALNKLLLEANTLIDDDPQPPDNENDD
jgi:hypothetical protein